MLIINASRHNGSVFWRTCYSKLLAFTPGDLPNSPKVSQTLPLDIKHTPCVLWGHGGHCVSLSSSRYPTTSAFGLLTKTPFTMSALIPSTFKVASRGKSGKQFVYVAANIGLVMVDVVMFVVT